MMLTVVSILACQFSPPHLTPSTADRAGLASVYSHESGSGTASGQKLDREALTAAHRTLPFGSKVKVTNKSNRRDARGGADLGIHRAYASEHRRRSIARRSTLEDVDDIFLAGRMTHEPNRTLSAYVMGCSGRGLPALLGPNGLRLRFSLPNQ
jgi:hypothetical protein